MNPFQKYDKKRCKVIIRNSDGSTRAVKDALITIKDDNFINIEGSTLDQTLNICMIDGIIELKGGRDVI